jgi:acyl-CoA hydrolase
MNRSVPVILDDVEACVDAILARVGKTVVIGLALGLGKPVQLINALYARAKADPTIRLRILTALSLEKPEGASPLERAFLEPFVQRVFGDCPDLDYAADLRKNRLPPNVEICEFFFRPGSLLNNAHAQQHYISSNYSHAARDVFAQGCNVAASVVARRDTPDGTRYSLSCNPDTAPELIAMLRASDRPHVVVAQVNPQLPYMAHDAEVEPELFDIVVDHPRYHTQLFGTPKMAVETADYLIGLQASALIRDGGTLQIGIGALGDAIVYSTLLRQQHNDVYRQALTDCGITDKAGGIIQEIGGTGPFEQGLYGATEMFVDGFLHLYRAGILKRRVYDFWALQQLVSEGRVHENRLTPAVLDGMEALGVRVIRTQDFEVLQRHSLFRDDCRYELGHIIAPDGERIMANLAIPESRQKLAAKCLGEQLRNGIVLHGGFFLGPNDFYQGLRKLPEEERRLICMTGVNKINQLDLNPRLYHLHRHNARFMNTGLMCTLSGAVVSDGLADGRVISGVGGQYNFVAMAHQLRTGRSILMIRSRREAEGAPPSSNIVFNYGHITIPRHLRDIVITEYGIAVLRSKTDSEVARALLNVADSRFQPELLAQAKKAGKLPADYQIPEDYRHNRPERLEAMLAPQRRAGRFPAFPLGCDFTGEELALGKALRGIKARVGAAKFPWRAILDSYKIRDIPAAARPYLQRLRLERADTFKDRLVQRLLVLELRQNGVI